MSGPSPKTIRELLADLARTTERAHELAQRTQSPLEEELRDQLLKAKRRKSKSDGGGRSNEA